MFRNAVILIFWLMLHVTASARTSSVTASCGSSFRKFEVQQNEGSHPQAFIYQTLSFHSIFSTDASPAEEYRGIGFRLSYVELSFCFFSQHLSQTLQWNYPSHHFW